MQMEHVGGSVFELGRRKGFGRPIRALLLFGQIDAQKVARKILQAVPVGEGPRQARRDLGAIDGRRHDAKGKVQHGKIETGEVKNLDQIGIGQQAFQVPRPLLPAPDLDDMAVPSPADSWTTQRRSRPATRPRVSVSIATLCLNGTRSGKSPR